MEGNWKPNWLKQKKEHLKPDELSVSISVAIQFGMALGIALFILVHLGIWIDSHLNTGFFFMIVGVLLAVFSALYIMIRRILNMEKKIMDGDE